jgi:hypothetical protein
MTLQHLDTVIAFATVMLGVSLLITVLTQIVAALSGLRGANLRWGIRKLLTTMDNANAALNADQKGDENELEMKCETLADKILRHPLISDSNFSRFEGWPGFKWLIGRFKLANGIRKEELINILGKLGVDDTAYAALKTHHDAVKLHIETWFDTVMDRVSQRFAMSTRMWTVFFAVVMAVVLHLDTLALLRKLSQDQTVRARLVASADAVVRETSRVLGAAGETNVFAVSIDQLKETEPVADQQLTNATPPLMSPEAAYVWVRAQLGNHPQAAKVLAEYHRIASSNIIVKAPELMGSVAIVHDELARAGLELLPDYKSIKLRDYSPLHSSFWGMLVSVILLSLGAPFWFNGLKTLLTLRPILATRMHKEQEMKTEHPK